MIGLSLGRLHRLVALRLGNQEGLAFAAVGRAKSQARVLRVTAV